MLLQEVEGVDAVGLLEALKGALSLDAAAQSVDVDGEAPASVEVGQAS